jgi:hypothetical protein
MSRRATRLVTLGALSFGLAVTILAAFAQPPFWQGGRRFRYPPRFPTADTFDGTFNFCRVMYDSITWEAGGQGWGTDYPSADVNLSIRLSELTRTRVGRDRAGEPRHVVVRLTDDALFRCPFVIMEDAGTAGLGGQEIESMRAYLLKGGFLWVDDFWGTEAWDNWTSQIARVLPPAEYPIIELTPGHPLFRTLFEVAVLPQIPSIQFWRQSGGLTSERGSDSAEPHARGIADSHGRLMVLMTHNTDIADGWEREGEDQDFFYRFSVDGYAVGINVLIYAMTH